MRELTRILRSPCEQISNPPRSLRKHWKSRDPSLRDRPHITDGVSASFSRLRQDWIETLRHPAKSGDVLSGLTVAAVALPLNVALAVSCGLPPAVGIISGAIGGAVAALLGGAPLQVTGPAAALGVLVLGLVSRWGIAGAAAGALCVGLIQVLLFLLRSGRFMKYVPEAVLAGFTTGVGLKLLDQQIPLLFDVSNSVAEMVRTMSDPIWLQQVRWTSVVSGLTVILFMLGLARYRKLPAAIFGLALVTIVSEYLGWDLRRVGEIPAMLPGFQFPDLPMSEWGALFLACVPLAILAAAESLLSAKAVDRMAKEKSHAPNLEIFGQSMANFASGFFGGMPVSGVVVRSSVNVNAGAKTRFSALLHAGLLLAAPLYFGDWIAKLPLAALAGLLCFVGYRLVEVSTGLHLWRENPRYGIAFLIAAAGVVSGELTAGLLLALLVAGRGGASEKKAEKGAPTLPVGVRAVIKNPLQDPFAQTPKALFRPPEENWEAHVTDISLVHPTAFVHPNASVIGRVVLGAHVHVAAEAALRADEGTPFFVGSRTNVQDGVVLHALKGKWVVVDGRQWAIYVGERVSLAHQALVHGPCFIGDDTFVGFKAVVHDAVVGRGCWIGIGAIVVGVEIPEDRFVPHGSLIDTPEKAMALPQVEPHQRHFNEDVVEVNHGLVNAYRGGWTVPQFPDSPTLVF